MTMMELDIYKCTEYIQNICITEKLFYNAPCAVLNVTSYWHYSVIFVAIYLLQVSDYVDLIALFEFQVIS